VYDLGWIPVLLKIVRQGEDAYGEVINPYEIAEWFIPIIEFGGMYEHAMKTFFNHSFFSGSREFLNDSGSNPFLTKTPRLLFI
jgi:hypothetical protein